MKYTKLAMLIAVLALGSMACSKKSPTADPTDTGAPAGSEHVVSVKDSVFDPATVTVAVGDTVIWDWVDTTLLHNVVSSDGTVNSGPATADPDTDFSFTFGTAGTFDYMCSVHGVAMAGTVTVA
jgi:plastocyanin